MKLDIAFEWIARAGSGWQYGEQGMIDAVLGVLGDSERLCVEYGAGDGGDLPIMTQRLIDRGWNAMLGEADEKRAGSLREAAPGPNVSVVARKIGPGEVLALTGGRRPDVLVIDIDGHDYYHVEALDVLPRLLVVEHHDLADPAYPDVAYVPPKELCGMMHGPGEFFIQANAAAMDELCARKGMTLVARTRVNSLYVPNDLADKLRRPCVKLNLGAGDKPIEDWINLDIKTGDDVEKLPYPDGSVQEVYASHVLEHFPVTKTVAVLKEWARVLAPGGVLRIAVPDLAKIAENRREWNAQVLDRVIFGGQRDEHDVHRAGFDREILMRAMWAAGIGWVHDFEPFHDDCSRHPFSLNLAGTKREYKRIENPKIVLVLSQPRFTFTRHEEKLLKLRAVVPFEVMYSKGAFWDRDMEITVEAALERYDPDYLLFSDYDSVFEPSDAQALLNEINRDGTMAAIGSVQMSRHNDKPLVFEPNVDYSTEITRVRFQHFGLTLIRADVFREMRKPWFWSQPGVDPETGEVSWRHWNRSDADIAFWRQMTEMGFEFYQHNGVCIGHEIHAIKYPSKSGKGFILVPAEVYDVRGKPQQVGFNPALFMPKEDPRPLAKEEPEKCDILGNPEE